MTAPSPLARYLAGELSAPIALMHLLIAARDLAPVKTAIAQLAADDPGDERAAALRRFLAEHRADAEGLAALLRELHSREPETTLPRGGIAECRAFFDRLADRQPEAGVALYALGSAALLARFTEEIVAVLRGWAVLSPRTRLLDLGCGIGRVAAALAPEVASIVAFDIAPRMLEEARRRCAGIANLAFVLGSGRDLQPIADRSIDLVLAVDSFPYIVQCGTPLIERHLAEAARVLARGGELVILNFSYRGLAEDRRDIAELAPRHGFSVLLDGARPFTLWDGTAFRLRRASRRARGSAARSVLR